MKKQIVTFLIAALTLAVSGFARGDDDVSVGVEEFEGFIVFCAPLGPPIAEEELPDGRVRVTFVNEGNIWLTDNELTNGLEFNISVATGIPAGDTDIRQRGTVDVDAVDGQWRFRQYIEVRGEFPNQTGQGYGVAIGRGDLGGKILLFETGTIGPIVPNSPCGIPFGAPLRGRIYTLSWLG